nr:DNA repair protein RadC [Hutsoniella sourekii]
MKIKSYVQEVPEDVRPRERLKIYGAAALSNQELLAILFRTGTKDYNVMELAMYFLMKFENLQDIKNASLDEYESVKGIGPIKAIELKAAIELGVRIASSHLPKHGKVTSTHLAGQWLIKEMGHLQQEVMTVLFLNSKNEIIRYRTIFKGTINTSVAHPREIFKEAVRYPTARLIVAHNHPSGNTEPSHADLIFTRRLRLCGEMMGIELLDHLIIGDQAYLSLKEKTDIFED